MKVIGFVNSQFPDQNDPNKMVTGVQLFCTYPVSSSRGEGESFSKNSNIFVSEWILKNRMGGEIPPVGSEIFVERNKDGRLQNIIRVMPQK